MTDVRELFDNPEELEALRAVCEAEPPAEHVVHLPETKSFSVPKGYDYRLNAPVQTFFHRLLWNIVVLLLVIIDTVFFGLRIEGRENLRPLKRRGFVSVSNHVHMMDCTAVALALSHKRLYTATLESNFRIPGIRHLVRALGGVPLPRSPVCMAEFIASMRSAIAEGCAVQIYPEGVLLPYADTLRPFHKGAFTLAASIGAPVLPIAVKFRKPHGLFALYKRKPCMTLMILPPVWPDASLSGTAAARDLRLRVFCEMFCALSD